jgi:hypothetical protein
MTIKKRLHMKRLQKTNLKKKKLPSPNISTKHPTTQKNIQKNTPRATEEGEVRGAQVRGNKKVI